MWFFIIVGVLLVAFVLFIIFPEKKPKNKVNENENKDFFRIYYSIPDMSSAQIDKIRDDLFEYHVHMQTKRNINLLFAYDESENDSVISAEEAERKYQAARKEKLPRQIHGCLTYGEAYDMFNETTRQLKLRGEWD
ncbi:MAG: hypothetical protein ACI4JG_08840 [Acutalibacteraceae bacterium]